MDQLADIVQQYLKPGMVLIDLKHNRQTDLIKVTIDGEEPLNIGDTEALARSLRVSHELVHQFPHGFQLEVSTSGIYSPLIEPYQFRKNKGRILIVEYVDNKIQKHVFGKLIDANDQEIRIDVDGIRSIISYDKIKKAKVKISFG
tara:strand:- start:921 stop:1355 length:435 start_codon:yes stop_codon:yes gene_type:complete